MEFAFLSYGFGYVNVEEAYRVGLELLFRWLIPGAFRQTTDAVSLETAVQ